MKSKPEYQSMSAFERRKKRLVEQQALRKKKQREDQAKLQSTKRGVLPQWGRTKPPALTRREFRVYVGTDDALRAFTVYKSILALFPTLGVESFALSEVLGGSVWLRIRAWSKRFTEKREVKVLASQIMQTAEAMTVDKALADNAAKYADVAAALVEAGKNAGSIAIDLGSFQFAQYVDDEGKVHVRAVAYGSKEIAQNRIDEETLKRPADMIQLLDERAALNGGFPPEDK